MNNKLKEGWQVHLKKFEGYSAAKKINKSEFYAFISRELKSEISSLNQDSPSSTYFDLYAACKKIDIVLQNNRSLETNTKQLLLRFRSIILPNINFSSGV